MTDDLARLLSQPLIETEPLNPEQQKMVEAHMERRRKVRDDIDTGLIAQLRQFAKCDEENGFIDRAIVATHAADRLDTLARLDREASRYVEIVICMRTHFTGEPPYVGWKGLGLALNEALDEARVAHEALEQILDDMGTAGLCCCPAAKAQGIAALAKASALTSSEEASADEASPHDKTSA